MSKKSYSIFLIVLILFLLTAAYIPKVSAAPIISAHPSIPVNVSIPRIKLTASVKAMGLTKDNKMAVPDNFTEVGWFAPGQNTTVPGALGNAVLGAHVDNGSAKPTVAGVFKNLHALVPGDDIYIKDEKGKSLHFRVTATKVYSYDNKTTNEIFGAAGEAHLNLITCYGKWLPKVATYDKRLVVFSVLV